MEIEKDLDSLASAPTDQKPFQIQPSIESYNCVLACIDISGFTALSTELDAQEFVYNINKYFEALVSIIQAHGGDLLKFAGDSILVLWRVIPIVEFQESYSDFSQAIQDHLLRAVKIAY